MPREATREELRQLYQREDAGEKTFIPAKPKVDLYGEAYPFRACAYCRVSADNDEQLSYREENGAFTSRKQLLKVPMLGPKAYEQCAGFLRIPESKNILDNTAVHPESYGAAEKLLALTGHTMDDVKGNRLGNLSAEVDALGRQKAAEAIGVGVPTLLDVVSELQKPGRDVRDSLPQPILRTDVMEMKDLKPGMVLSGTVRNVIDFGAFVDIGVHQDGLVHISEIAKHNGCERKESFTYSFSDIGNSSS